LNVHHIETGKIGGDAPNNPAALCEDCHNDCHEGRLKLDLKRVQSFRCAAFMGIMRWAFCNRLKKDCPNAGTVYGYIAKNTRIRNGLEKDHAVDAGCTGGSPLAAPLEAIYMQKAAGKRNRQIHKATAGKGGKRKLNQSPKYAFGFQLFGRVQMPDGRKGFVFGRRSSGSFDVRPLDGEKSGAGISYTAFHINPYEASLHH
jgi:N6-L-threonylcarbamoyladenine synthase